MITKDPKKRLPRSIRTFLRRQKAELRRTLNPEEAQKAIVNLMRQFRQVS